MRAFISKKSRAPCVFSPKDTMRASPTMSRRKARPSLGRERCGPSKGCEFASIHAAASVGTGGGAGAGGAAGSAGEGAAGEGAVGAVPSSPQPEASASTGDEEENPGHRSSVS